MIILPGDPLFEITLSTAIPPNWKETAEKGNDFHAFVVEPGSNLLRPVTWKEMEDYIYGGEYDERLEEIGEEEIE